MRNFVADGDNVPFVAAANVVSGQGILSGGLFGVASTDVLNGQPGIMRVIGVFYLPKAPSQAWTLHQRVYWDAANARVTNVLTGNTFIGVAYAAVAGGAGDIVGRVRLNGVSPV